MLNLGLIGDIQLLEPYIKKAQENPEIFISGKSSVGTRFHASDIRLSAPEFNRIELVERSDALLIDHFSLLPFQMLCDMVKKSKHFFAASYPDLSLSECNMLNELATEAKTVIQIANPFYYMPAVKWLNNNIRHPAVININYFHPKFQEEELVLKLLLMIKDITGFNPKRTEALQFESAPAESVLNVVSLEFSNGTRVAFNYGKMRDKKEFNIKTYSKNQFTELDFTHNLFLNNDAVINFDETETQNEIDSFADSVTNDNQKDITGIEDYSSVLQIVQLIKVRIDNFTGY